MFFFYCFVLLSELPSSYCHLIFLLVVNKANAFNPWPCFKLFLVKYLLFHVSIEPRDILLSCLVIFSCFGSISTCFCLHFSLSKALCVCTVYSALFFYLYSTLFAIVSNIIHSTTHTLCVFRYISWNSILIISTAVLITTCTWQYYYMNIRLQETFSIM